MRRALPTGLVAFVVLVAGCRGGPMPESRETAERLGNDLLVGRSEVVVTTAVPGDLLVAGGSIEFTGSTGGDFLGAGGSQRIAGTVEGSVRSAGGEIDLIGQVRRNVSLAAGQIRIAQGAVVAENAYLAAGDVRIDGAINGGARIFAGDVVISGTVDGDLGVRAGELRIGPGARVGGSLRYAVPAGNVSIDPNAQIAGEVVALPVADRWAGWAWLRLIWHLGFLLAGALAVALMPRFNAAAAALLRPRLGAAAGFGLLWIFLLPLLAIGIAVTLIGIPLALIAVALYVISLYLGRTVVALWIGERLLGPRVSSGRWGLVLMFLLGGFLLILVSLVPFLGPLTMIVATILGIGAAVTVLVRPGRERGEVVV